jgi:hypothetical protein
VRKTWWALVSVRPAGARPHIWRPGQLPPLPARKRRGRIRSHVTNMAWNLSGTRCVPFRVPPYCAVLGRSKWSSTSSLSTRRSKLESPVPGHRSTTTLRGAQLVDFDGMIDRGAADDCECANVFDSVGPLFEGTRRRAGGVSGTFRGGRSGPDDKYRCSVICSRTSIARRR